jgi:4-oxalocrotonate tautomerase
MENIVAVLHATLDAAPSRMTVSIDEIEPELWLVDGRPASELAQGLLPAAVDNPLIEINMVDGRPLHVIHHLQRELTAGTAHALGVQADRVRVVIRQIPADDWSMGGTSVAVARAENLAARTRADGTGPTARP